MPHAIFIAKTVLSSGSLYEFLSFVLKMWKPAPQPDSAWDPSVYTTKSNGSETFQLFQEKETYIFSWVTQADIRTILTILQEYKSIIIIS